MINNEQYEACRGGNLTEMARFWADATGSIKGVHGAQPPKFDLSGEQKRDFAMRASVARLGASVTDAAFAHRANVLRNKRLLAARARADVVIIPA